ncbi:lysyl-tRNA ligase [Candidatus Mycoplasma haematolamae str. Purdue]|uniref:Lysine--tRNA ligase n=1 Tax=Mycoplasma haematolamae (strain Purdue) TaxID=1212765 RepID=I7CIL9_MYCHA|nr:lysine--tRNA ligase [Candidatus Mycoplasma haematolamae]AFO51719.1 lysyl-tRNA ligase [Candidatus Mycoplasma haematolamae str. Purdue]
MRDRKLNDQEEVRRRKLERLKESNCSPYIVERVLVTHSLEEILSLDESYQEEIGCAGRILFIRQTFLVISESASRLQLYIDLKDSNKEAVHTYFKEFIDIGDYIFCKGHLFKTKTGALTLSLNHIEIISKCLKPLPEKHTGITDPELLVRNRTGSLIVNSELFNDLRERSLILFELRSYLNKLGYMEVETPILHKIAGGATARPFKTYHNTLKEDLYLRVAPELYLKRLIVSGFTKVFEIGRSFRNEGIDSTHNPEFSSIEIYTAYQDMDDTISLTERLISNLLTKFLKEDESNAYLKKPFRRAPIWELLRKKTGLDFWANPPTLEEAIVMAEAKGIELEQGDTNLSRIYEKFFEELIEPELIEPTFVYGFSSLLSPLAKKDLKNDFFSRRFELYIGGKEIANGFSEQNDPLEQERQFEAQLQEDPDSKEVDYDYLSSLEYGLPPTGGVGIGLDRLVMLLLNRKSIKDVLAFPYLKG